MGKMAEQMAVKQLQKIFDFLGEFGGTIETNEVKTWWNLNLEVEYVEGDKKNIFIGVFSTINGDVIYDPLFYLSLTMDNDKILEAEITGCEETTVFGTTVIDGNDMLHGFGMTEKDPYGLVNRFSDFIDNMAENGPYLKNPKEVKKYNKTLAD